MTVPIRGSGFLKLEFCVLQATIGEIAWPHPAPDPNYPNSESHHVRVSFCLQQQTQLPKLDAYGRPLPQAQQPPQQQQQQQQQQQPQQQQATASAPAPYGQYQPQQHVQAPAPAPSPAPTPAPAPAVSSTPTLPPGWQAVPDKSSGDNYYWNKTTGETTWDFPTK